MGRLGLMVSVLRDHRRVNFGITADGDAGTDTAMLAEATEKAAAEQIAAAAEAVPRSR